MKCVAFRKNPKQDSYLLGWADICVDKWGCTIHKDFMVFKKNNQFFVKLPSQEYLDKEGNKKYRKNFSFEDYELEKAFLEKVTEVIKEYLRQEGGS